LAISGLSKRAWTWAMRHAAVARNKLATRQLDGGRYVTPHELFYGRVPSLSHSVIFGAPCSVLLLGPDREELGKFGVPAEKGFVLGHGEDGFQWLGTYRQAMGYIVLLGSNKVVFTKHCRIDERMFAEGGHTPFSLPPQLDATPPLDATPQLLELQNASRNASRNVSQNVSQNALQNEQPSLPPPTTTPTLLPQPALPQPPPLLPQPQQSSPQPPQQLPPSLPPSSPSPSLPPPSRPPSPPLSPVPPPTTPQLNAAEQLDGADMTKALDLRYDPLRRDRASRSKTKAAARSAATLTADQVAIPRTYKQAMSSPHAAHWRAAIEDHLHMHDKQKSYRAPRASTSRCLQSALR
jgi:hypothetical protein